MTTTTWEICMSYGIRSRFASWLVPQIFNLFCLPLRETAALVQGCRACTLSTVLSTLDSDSVWTEGFSGSLWSSLVMSMGLHSLEVDECRRATESTCNESLVSRTESRLQCEEASMSNLSLNSRWTSTHSQHQHNFKTDHHQWLRLHAKTKI